MKLCHYCKHRRFGALDTKDNFQRTKQTERDDLTLNQIDLQVCQFTAMNQD